MNEVALWRAAIAALGVFEGLIALSIHDDKFAQLVLAGVAAACAFAYVLCAAAERGSFHAREAGQPSQPEQQDQQQDNEQQSATTPICRGSGMRVPSPSAATEDQQDKQNQQDQAHRGILSGKGERA